MHSSNANNSHYIHSLTPLRAIAALWVVFFHIDVSLYYRDLGALVPRTASGIFSQGYLWVDFFFLLSGFIIAHVYGARLSSGNKPGAIKEYLWARFARVYPLHLFTLAALMLATPLVAHYFPSVVDDSWRTYFAWSALPANLLFTNAMNQHVYLSWNMVSWSIGAEWWTYVAALVLVIGLWQKKLRWVIPAMLLAFAALAALVYALPGDTLDITFDYGFFRCLCEFVLGLGVYQWYLRHWAQPWLRYDLSFLFLLAVVVCIFHYRLPDLLIIPVFILLLLAAAYNRTRVCAGLNLPALQYLGTISYSIYLMHGIWFLVFWFALPGLKFYWVSTEHSSGISSEFPLALKLSYIVIFLMLTLISAHFSYRYIEVPGRRWFNPGAKSNALSAPESPNA